MSCHLANLNTKINTKLILNQHQKQQTKISKRQETQNARFKVQNKPNNRQTIDYTTPQMQHYLNQLLTDLELSLYSLSAQLSVFQLLIVIDFHYVNEPRHKCTMLIHTQKINCKHKNDFQLPKPVTKVCARK